MTTTPGTKPAAECPVGTQIMIGATLWATKRAAVGHCWNALSAQLTNRSIDTMLSAFIPSMIRVVEPEGTDR